jgi:hypothetical protein
MAENKYDIGARQIVDDLRDSKWDPVLGSTGDHSSSTSHSPLAIGLLLFAAWAIWRLR